MKKLPLLFAFALIINLANAQYCIPTYTNLCASGDFIDGIDFQGISNSATGCNGNPNNYLYTSTDTAEVRRNGTYPITLTPASAWDEGFGVWIDFNADGDFSDVGEFVLATTVGKVPVMGSISIPGAAALGTTMMRVRCVYNAVVLEADSCNLKPYGETEDYPINISLPPPNDVGVAFFDAPSSDCQLSSSEVVTVTVINYGLNTQSNIPVSYRVNGGGAINETISGPIVSGDTAVFNFTTTYDLSTPGTYVFDAWTALSGDTVMINDSVTNKTVNIITMISSYPYLEDFESGSGDWVAKGNNTSWAFGLPEKTVIDTAASGINAWVTGGLTTGTYNANENSSVVSPCFNFSSLTIPIIKLSIWWNSTFSADGTVLQSSIDGGITWQNVGSMGDPDNWYTDNSIIGNPGEQQVGWSGRASSGNGSGGWVNARHELTGLGGESSVILRIAFGSDGFTHDDGFAFDDVSITEAPAKDVGVIDFLAPLSGCGLTATETVTVRVVNFGSASQSNIPVSYRMNGGGAVNEVITGPLNPGDTATYAFTSTADLSTPGNNIFDSWTDLSGDGYLTNDSTFNHSVDGFIVLSSFPYLEDFESGNGGWSASGDNSSWAMGLPQKPVIDTAASGINSWVTGGLAAGTYNASENSYVMSPCFDFSSLIKPIIEVNIWWNSENAWDGAVLQSSINGGLTWQNVGAFGDPDNWYNHSAIKGNPGSQQEGWTGRISTSNGSAGWVHAMNTSPSLSGESGVIFRVAFGSDAAAHDDGFAFDDFSITESPADDVGIIAFDSPQSGCELTSTESVSVSVVNFGIASQTNIPVTYQVNGGTPVNETMAGPLNPGDTAIFTFTTTYDLSNAGNYVFDAWTNLSGDADNSNDSTLNFSIDIAPIISTFPYFENFESGAGDWIAGGTNSSWALGIPQKTVINSPASGINSWVTGGLTTATYNPSENSYVRSPCFDFSGMSIPIIELKIWWNSEFSWDGAVLQSSVDGGGSWQNIGSMNDPNNWYNDSLINGNPGGQQVGWTGRASTGDGSNGWVAAKHSSATLGGESTVMLRIAFGADPSIHDDGFAFDDIRIYDTPVNDVGVTSVDAPVSRCSLSATEQVTIVVTNSGLAPQTNIPVSYSLNGGAPINEVITSTVAAGAAVSYTFSATVDLTAQIGYSFDLWTTLGTDSVSFNDSILGHTVQNNPILSTFPLTEDFESEVICANTCGSACPLIGNWSNSTNDYADWTVTKGGTPTPNTGPLSDHTLGTADGNYLYLESSTPCSPSVEAVLTSSCLDLSTLNDPQLLFWYHMFGVNMGTLMVEIDTTGTWVAIDSIVGTQQSSDADPWIKKTVTIPSFPGVLRVRLRGITGLGVWSDMAIDDLTIRETPISDVSVLAIMAPLGGCGLTTNESITVEITNLGIDTLINFPISYVLNGGTPVNEVIIDTIGLGEVLTYTFSQTADFTTEELNSLVVYTSLSGDENLSNDTVMANIFYGDVEIYVVINTSTWGNEVEWEILNNSSNNVVASGSGYLSDSSYVDTVCLSSTSTYTFKAIDTYGDGWNGGTYAITRCDTSNIVVNNGGNTPDNTQCCGSELESTEVFSVYPCIPNNLGVVAITEPVSSCELSDSAIVSIQVFNFGDSSQVNIPVGYRLNGGAPIIEMIADSIHSGEYYSYTFTTTTDLSTQSSHLIDAWTGLVNDSIKANDTLFGYSIVDADISVFPYKEDFETFVPGLPGILKNKWKNDSLDDFEWYVHTGPTPSFNTGPDGDQSSGAGVYMYARSAFQAPADTAILYSPCINISLVPNPRLGFWYHLYGTDIGGLYVEWDSSGTWVQLASITGQQQSANSDPWKRAKIDLSGYMNMRQLRFIAVVAGGSEGDIALDDIKIYSEHCNNGIIDFDEDGIDCGGEDCNFNCPVTFQRAYGGVEEELGYSAYQTSDGGHVIAATTKSFGFAQTLFDIYVVKIDSLGDTLWTQTYGETGNDYVNAISQTADDGFIIAGHTESFGIGAYKNDFYLIKTDSTGAIEWSKTYAQNGTSNDQCYSVIQTIDLGYALVGKAGGSHIVKTDATGNVQWSSQISDVDLRSITQVSNDDYVVAGSTTEDQPNVVLMKVHPVTDSIVWSKQYGGFGRDYGSSVDQTSDGGYVIGGYSFSFGTGGNPVAYMIKTDTAGTEEWSTTYGGAEPDYSYSVKQTSDDGYILSGETRSFGNSGNNLFLVRTDTAGGVVWGRVFDAGNVSTGNGNYVQQTNDNGFLAIGSTKKIGTGTFANSWSDLDKSDVYLIKTDPYGNTFLCYETDIALTLDTTNPATVEQVLVVSMVSMGSEASQTTIPNTTATETINLDYIDITGFNKRNVSCFNGDDGYAVVQSTGGTDHFAYTWLKANPYYGWSYSADSAFSLRADDYYVTIWAKNACTSSDTVSIKQPNEAISIPYTTSPVTCYGDSNGAANVMVSGGTTPYTYLWSTGDSIQGISNVISDTYSLQVLDSNNCSSTESIFVSEPLEVSASYNVNLVTCKSGDDGAVNMTMNAGIPPFIYSWSSGDNSEDIDTLTSGTYHVTVTDSTNCVMQDSITVDEPDSLIAIMSHQSTSCNGYCDGTTTVTGSGGTQPFTYLWDDPSTQTTVTATGLCVLSYSVVLTDANNCLVVDSVTVTQPMILTTTMSKTDVTCNGNGDGTASATVSGGTTPYTYLWNNGQISSTSIGLFPGTYGVNIFDANGCLTSNNIVVNEPAGLSLSLSAIDVSCIGGVNGTANLNVSGGTSPYSYIWSTGDTTEDLSGIVSGSYSVTVSDSCGSISTSSTIISEPDSLASIITVSDLSCNAGTDGEANLTISGGTSPYTYLWSNGAITEDITGVATGMYGITITDFCGTVVTDSALVAEPILLTTTIAGTDVSCFGYGDGSAVTTPSGGTSPYLYSWNNGQTNSNAVGLFVGNYTVNVIDVNGCLASNIITINGPDVLSIATSTVGATCNNTDGSASVSVSGGTSPFSYLWNDSSAQTDSLATALNVGPYSVLVVDGNGCSDSANVMVDTEVEAPAICLISIDSATEQYVIVWEKTTTSIDSFRIYRESSTTSVYDLIGSQPYADESAFLDLTSYPEVKSELYKISAIDSCGNESVLSAFHRSLHLLSSPGLGNNVVLSWDNYIGFPFSKYRIWRGGSQGNLTVLDSISSSISTFTDTMPPALDSLFYQIEVVHPSGCVATKTKNFNSSKSNTSSISTAVNITASVSSNDASVGICDGEATVTAMGGDAPYTYQWDSGTGNQTSQTATGLCAGMYNVTVYDANGDSIITAAAIGQVGGIITATTVTTDATQSLCDGTATVTPIGGFSPYTYVWDGNAGSQTSQTASNLCAGTYSVTVIDSLGNQTLAFATVSTAIGINDETSSTFEVQVFPNPNQGLFNVTFYLTKKEDVTLEIFNIHGQKVLNEDMGRLVGTVLKPIDISLFASGVYYVRIMTSENISLEKIVVE